MVDEGILRIVDANFNRCKEGLRVVEDILRFVVAKDSLRKKARKLRHSLDSIIEEAVLKKAALSRNSRQDLGRKVDSLELRRKGYGDILYSNLQRSKESIRVLEEFFKIIALSKVGYIKKLRYELYSLEKAIIKGEPSLHTSRRKNI